MDTQPSPQHSQFFPEATPPVETLVSLRSNKPGEIILGIVLVLIITGTGAYFLFGKNSATPNTQIVPIVSEQPPTQVNGLPKIKNYTLQEVGNALLSKPYLDGSKFYINDQGISLKDNAASFSYCDVDLGQYTCDGHETKSGTVTLLGITPSKDPSLLRVYDGSADGVAILNFNFSGRVESYLGAFTLYNQENKSNLYFSNIKNLGPLAGEIQSINIESNGEVHITITTPSGALNRVFTIISGRNSNTFIELTSDRQQKIYDDQVFGFSFNYPKEISISRGQSLRAWVMETDLKTSPIYYTQECGLQPSLADSSVPIWAPNQNGSDLDPLNATLTVHQVGTSLAYLTSALYGYNPADWGKIKLKFSVPDYIKAIKAGASISGREVSLENIQGYTVRHIMPFSVGRPCDEQNREQYQWVMGNLLFNLIFTESKTEPVSIQQKTELINSIFSSLVLK